MLPLAQEWNSGVYVLGAVGHDADDLFSELVGGVKSALTCYSGSSDPSSGAPTAWGASEVGTWWKDTTDVDNIVLKQWQRLTAVPAYGWRTMRYQKDIAVAADVDAVAVATHTSDLAFTDVDLSAVLSASVKDSGQLLATVRRVRLQVYVKITDTAHPTGLKCYVALRQKGLTAPVHYVVAQILNIPVYAEVECGLNTAQVFQYAVDTNGGANDVEVGIKILSAKEPT